MRGIPIVCAALLATSTFAQSWSSAGPYGGATVALAASSSRVLYAGSAGGVFRSEDGGATWIDIGGSIRDVTVVAADPEDPATAYAASISRTEAIRLNKTIDAGTTWTDTGLTQGEPISIAIDPQNPKTIFVAFGGGVTCGQIGFKQSGLGTPPYSVRGGVFKSVDGGQSWTPAFHGISGSPFPREICVWELALDPAAPSHLYASTLYTAWQSLDGGTTWQAAPTPVPTRKVVAHPQLPLTRYGIRNSSPNSSFNRNNRGSVLVTHDGGLTWTATAGTGLPAGGYSDPVVFNDLATDPLTGRLFLATSQGTFRSGDGGENWLPVAGAAARLPAYHVAVDSADSRLMIGTLQGVFYASLPGADPWSVGAMNDLSTNVMSIAVDPSQPNIVYASTADAFNGFGQPLWGRVFRSRDAGRSWKLIPDDDPRPHGAIAVDAAGDAYAVGPYGLSRLPAGSDGWINQFGAFSFSIPGSQSVTTDPHLPGVVFVCGTASGLLRTRDGGKTWQTTPVWTYQIAIDPTDSRRVYAATAPFGFLRSTDGGDTWPELPPLLFPPNIVANPAQRTWSVAVAASKPNVVYRLSDFFGILTMPYELTYVELFRSDDFGATWKMLRHPAEGSGPAQVLIDPRDENVVFIVYFYGFSGGAALGILRSADGGVTWKSLNDGVLNTVVYTTASYPADQFLRSVIDPDGQFLRMGTLSAGVWQLRLLPRGRVVRSH